MAFAAVIPPFGWATGSDRHGDGACLFRRHKGWPSWAGVRDSRSGSRHQGVHPQALRRSRAGGKGHARDIAWLQFISLRGAAGQQPFPGPRRADHAPAGDAFSVRRRFRRSRRSGGSRTSTSVAERAGCATKAAPTRAHPGAACARACARLPSLPRGPPIPPQYFIKPTKQRQANESNKTFYQGVREVEAVMGRVLEDHKNMGFG